MVEPLRHRRTKGAETDMLDLTPPRHASTLPLVKKSATAEGGRRPQCGDLGGDRPNPQRSGQDRHHGGHATGERVATHPMRWGATATSDVELDRQCDPVDE